MSGPTNRSVRPLNIWLSLGLASFMLGAGSIVLNGIALSVTLGDGRTAFSRPPQLLGASVSPDRTNARVATYRFSVSHPNTAGEPLQAIELAQQPNLEAIRFNLDLARAETSDRSLLPSSLDLLTQPTGPDKLRIAFEPPIPPGTEFELVLKARRNPRRGGTYLFGVEAFPRGNNSQSQFLGYGRFQFHERGDRERQRFF